MGKRDARTIDGFYLKDIHYSYSEYKECVWNISLLAYYPVSQVSVAYWARINEALFRFFYGQDDGRELERLLDMEEIDEYWIERLVIGIRIFNTLCRPEARHAQIAFKRLAEAVGLTSVQLRDYIPSSVCFYKDDSKVLTEIYKTIPVRAPGANRRRDARTFLFKHEMELIGHEILSYRLPDFKADEGLLFTKPFILILDVIAQRKRLRMKKYFLEYDNSSEYTVSSFGLCNIIKNGVVDHVHDMFADMDFLVPQLLEMYHLNDAKGIW